MTVAVSVLQASEFLGNRFKVVTCLSRDSTNGSWFMVRGSWDACKIPTTYHLPPSSGFIAWTP